MAEADIVSAVRTAVGSFGGTLKDISAADLGAIVIKEAVKRAGIQLADVIFQDLSEQVFRFCAVRLAGFDLLHKTGRGDLGDGAFFFKPVQQRIEFFFPQCHFRGHDADAAAGEMVCCQLQRRLNTDDNSIRVGGPQIPNSGGGGSIAGYHQGFDRIARDHC